LDLALNYLAQQYARGSAQLNVSDDAAHVSASVRVPQVPFELFLNVETVLREFTPLPRFERTRVGWLPVPGVLADRIVRSIVASQIGPSNFDALVGAIRRVRVGGGELAVTYEWQPRLDGNIRSAVLPPDERERMRIYHEHLGRVTRSLPARDIHLSGLMASVFALAEERSRNGDPRVENGSAILILAVYATHIDIAKIAPEARAWEGVVYRTVTLNGRSDLAKHFIVSATLAAKLGGPVADAVGLYKEMSDARTGSGFSFNDIAANRAGMRFGEKAVGSLTSARTLQARVGAGITDSDIAPETADLPEYLSEAELERRFGGIDGPGYSKLMAEIERRVEAVRLYW
jgi:hypothetical protein